LGIDKSDVDKIFQPFLRGSGVSNIQGTGLGLSIVKRSVELLSGEIKVESVLGEGTTFTVKLPINPV
jgi:signal transduction histidine kinase